MPRDKATLIHNEILACAVKEETTGPKWCVTYAKSTLSNWDLIFNLIILSTFLRNVNLTGHSGTSWSALVR